MPGRVNQNPVVMRGGSQVAPGVVVSRIQKSNRPIAGQPRESIGCGFQNFGAAVESGAYVDVVVPYSCVLRSCRMVADRVGSVIIDIRKTTMVLFPPSASDSICTGSPPTISASDHSIDTELHGWTTSIEANEVLRFFILSSDTIRKVTLSLGLDP